MIDITLNELDAYSIAGRKILVNGWLSDKMSYAPRLCTHFGTIFISTQYCYKTGNLSICVRDNIVKDIYLGDYDLELIQVAIMELFENTFTHNYNLLF